MCSDLNEARHESGPTGLMTCPDSSAVVAMKVFIEENQIPPVRVVLELLMTAVNRSLSLLTGENADQAARELGRDLLQIHHLARAGGALYLEIRPKIAMPAVKGVNEDKVDREPNWAAPVGVTAKHSGVGLSRFVGNPEGLTIDGEAVGLVVVVPREGTDAVIAEKLLRFQHARQNASQFLGSDYGEHAVIAVADFVDVGE